MALGSPRFVLVAGTFDDVVVGIALASSEGQLATVEELYVEPRAREVGVGEAMLEFIVVWAGAKLLAFIDYPALPGDRSSKNLGERSGFSARLLVMHRRL